MTHSDLIVIASEWLTENLELVLLVTEPKGMHLAEEPDVWALDNMGRTYCVECKVSKADAGANKSKPHAAAGKGCGMFRWYCSPDGIMRHDSVRLTDWGLLSVCPEQGACEAVPAQRRRPDPHADLYLAAIAASLQLETSRKERRAAKSHPLAGMVVAYLANYGDSYASEVIRSTGALAGMLKGATVKRIADDLADAARDGLIPNVSVQNRGGRPWLVLTHGGEVSS